MENNESIVWQTGYNIGAMSQSGMHLETIANLRTAQALTDDFLEWLFDKSGHLDHINFREAWQEFEEFNNH